jgi:membrane associated rhomboid family serine protease
VNRPHITEKSTLDDKNINPPMFDVPLVVLLLLGFLVLIHVLLNQLGSEGQAIKEGILAFNPERFLGEAALAQLPGSKWWSFLTSGFVHADWAHLGFNSIWLLIFGTPVARVLGSGRFLLLAGLSIIGGSAAILASYWGERISLLGASGGVAIPIMFGLGGTRTRNVTQSLAFNSYFNSQRALIVTAVMLFMQVFPPWLMNTSSLLTSSAFIDEHLIAWEAHLGGFIAGLILFFVLRRQMLPAQFKS